MTAAGGTYHAGGGCLLSSAVLDLVSRQDAIFRRVVYDPRPQANGADRSLRAWLRAVSSGLADMDPIVLPMQTIDKQVVEDSTPRAPNQHVAYRGTNGHIYELLR